MLRNGGFSEETGVVNGTIQAIFCVFTYMLHGRFFHETEKLWLTIIDTVTVHADGWMTFKFQGGTEIDV